MSITRFHFISALSAHEGIAALTDFGPSRPAHWPSIDAEHFTVHDRGENWAEVTEGTASAWERARYEWDVSTQRVDITTHDSKLFGAGGGWMFRFTPVDAGTRVDVELTRTPTTFSGKVLAALLPLIGPASLKKSFSGPLKAV